MLCINVKKQTKKNLTTPHRGQGGGTPIFSYIHMAWAIFGVQNFEILYFWGFQKNECFWGYGVNCGYFGGSLHYWTFLKARFRMGIFLGVTQLQIFILECLIVLIFYGVNSGCWAQAYVCRKIENPPLPHGRNDPRPKPLTAETTHQNRPNRLTPKFGRNDPPETTHGRNDPDSPDWLNVFTYLPI